MSGSTVDDIFDPNNQVFVDSLHHTKAIMDKEKTWKWPILMATASQQVVVRVHEHSHKEEEHEHDESLDLKMVGLAWKIVNILWKEHQEALEHKDFPMQSLLQDDQTGLTLVHLFINKEWKNRWHNALQSDGQHHDLVSALIKQHCQKKNDDSVEQLLCVAVLRHILQNSLSVRKNWTDIIRFAIQSRDDLQGEHLSQKIDDKAELVQILCKAIEVIFDVSTQIQPDCLSPNELRELKKAAKDFLDALLGQKWTAEKFKKMRADAVDAEKSMAFCHRHCGCCKLQ